MDAIRFDLTVGYVLIGSVLPGRKRFGGGTWMLGSADPRIGVRERRVDWGRVANTDRYRQICPYRWTGQGCVRKMPGWTTAGKG